MTVPPLEPMTDEDFWALLDRLEKSIHHDVRQGITTMFLAPPSDYLGTLQREREYVRLWRLLAQERQKR